MVSGVETRGTTEVLYSQDWASYSKLWWGRYLHMNGTDRAPILHVLSLTGCNIHVDMEKAVLRQGRV